MCSEYNFLGFRIQRNAKTQCNTCPTVYSSEENFKCKMFLDFILKQFCLFVVQVLYVKSDDNYILDPECYVVRSADRRHMTGILPIRLEPQNDQILANNIRFALNNGTTTIRNQHADHETR